MLIGIAVSIAVVVASTALALVSQSNERLIDQDGNPLVLA